MHNNHSRPGWGVALKGVKRDSQSECVERRSSIPKLSNYHGHCDISDDIYLLVSSATDAGALGFRVISPPVIREQLFPGER